MDLSDIEVGFAYGEDDTAVTMEIIRNVRTLLLTPIGTCPLYRDFGVDVAYLDFPPNIAKGLFTASVIEAVEKWEPRVRVTDVSFEANGLEGQLRAKVVIALESQ